jgi:hypothetical protein
MRIAAAILLSLIVVLLAAQPLPDSYVLRDGDITYMLGKGMSPASLKTIQHRYGEHFLWARRNGHEYIATDGRTMRNAVDVMQRNVARGPVTDRRMAGVVDAAVRSGSARAIHR